MNLSRLTLPERHAFVARMLASKATTRAGELEAEIRADREQAAKEGGERETALDNYYAFMLDDAVQPERIGR